MHCIVIVALTLFAVGVIAVSVTIPLVFHFRNKDAQSSSSMNTTTASPSMSTIGASTTVPIISTTTILSSTTVPTVSTTILSSTTVSTISTTRTSSATTTPTTNTGNTTIMQTQYSSVLTSNSPLLCHKSQCDYKLYFQAIEIHVSVDGNYSFQFNSSFASYAYLYSDSFDPNYWYINLLLYDYTYNEPAYLVLSYSLKSSQKYIVLVTPFTLDTGSFVVVGRGPGTMNFTLFNTSNAQNNNMVHSFYSSALVSNSSIFCRLSACSSGVGYYYQKIGLNVSVSGLYYIACNATIDSYGYLWTNSSTTYISENDDDAGNYQFLLTYYLNSTIAYWVVATTYSTLITGNFSIVTSGPAAITYTRLV